MTVLSVPLGLLMYQPQLRRMRSRALSALSISKWACISKDEMNGEMFSGSSGAMAPIGPQFSVNFWEMLVVRSGEATSKRIDMLFASCGWRVVEVALSLKAPNWSSQQSILITVFKAAARDVQVEFRPVVSFIQTARSEPVIRVRYNLAVVRN